MLNGQRTGEIHPAVGESLWWEWFVREVSLEPRKTQWSDDELVKVIQVKETECQEAGKVTVLHLLTRSCSGCCCWTSSCTNTSADVVWGSALDTSCMLPLSHTAVASPTNDDAAAAAAGDDGEDDDILTSVNTTLKSASTGDVEFLSYKPKQCS